MSLKRYRTKLILGAFADTLGYNNGHWEFNYNTQQIHREFVDICGLDKLELTDWLVSDDKVFHLATIRSLIEGNDLCKPQKHLDNNGKYYVSSFKDMLGRAPGTTTSGSIRLLQRRKRDHLLTSIRRQIEAHQVTHDQPE